ncbi:MAG: Hsp20/alpha crystallin family protein [Chthoniobacter sp.]
MKTANSPSSVDGRRPETPAANYTGSRVPTDFRRSFELDSSIDTPRVTARIDQGVLTLHLPKAEAVKPRKIAVS